MKNLNLENVEEAKEFDRVPAGGYICKITMVEDVEEKEYLRIEYDFTEGKFAGYYRDLYTNKGFWGGSFIKSYKEKALPFFKSFITSVEKSNSGYRFDNDEKKLVGKLVGLVLSEEEYRSNNGDVKTRLYVDQIRSVDAIRKGEYKVSALKKLPAESKTEFDPNEFEEISDEGMPF